MAIDDRPMTNGDTLKGFFQRIADGRYWLSMKREASGWEMVIESQDGDELHAQGQDFWDVLSVLRFKFYRYLGESA